MNGEPWLTKRELARKLRIHPRTVERQCLPFMRVGGQNRYLLSEVERFLQGQMPKAEVIRFPQGRGDRAA